MQLHITLGNCLIRLGRFVQSLAVVVMKPDDLVEFTRQMYATPKVVETWSNENFINKGLYPEELVLIEKIPLKQGQILILDVGGGREAIYFAQLGFTVTGLDFIPEMVGRAKENAVKKGVEIKGLVQEISKLDLPDNSYDIVWLFAAMYSSTPTRSRRIRMLKRMREILKPRGYFAFQFQWNSEGITFSKLAEFLRRVVAFLVLGNFCYEKGDMLLANREFFHVFMSEEELNSEFKEAGFEINYINISKERSRGEALLQKP